MEDEEQDGLEKTARNLVKKVRRIRDKDKQDQDSVPLEKQEKTKMEPSVDQ